MGQIGKTIIRTNEKYTENPINWHLLQEREIFPGGKSSLFDICNLSPLNQYKCKLNYCIKSVNVHYRNNNSPKTVRTIKEENSRHRETNRGPCDLYRPGINFQFTFIIIVA